MERSEYRIFIGGLVTISAVTLAFVVPWLSRRLREPGDSVQQAVQTELAALRPKRIWLTIIAQLCALCSLAYFLSRPHDILSVVLALLMYVLFISALTASLLFALPTVRKLWDDPMSKLFLAAVPVVGGYLAKAFAQQWVTDLFGMSASNLPMTTLAATCFTALLGVGLLLTVVAGVSQLLYLVAVAFEKTLPRHAGARPMWQLLFRMHPLSRGDQDRERMRRHALSLGLALLLALSSLSCYLATMTAFELPTSRLGNVALHAIAFDFDAASARYCELKDSEEERAVTGPEPFLRAIPLSSSQEKAFLVWRQPALFRPLRLRDLAPAEVKTRTIAILRIERCNLTAPERAEAKNARS